MKTRVIAGLCMVPLLGIVYLGGYWIMGAAFIIGLIGLKEFFDGFSNMGFKPNYIIGYVSLFILYVINLWAPGSENFLALWLFLTVVASILCLFNIEERKAEDVLATIVGVLYVVFFSFHILLIDQSCFPILIWIVLIAAFATDIFAYFSGYLFGNKKLCPHLSPKKTWAGAIGGTIGSIICCGLFGYFVYPALFIHCLVLGFVGAIAAQLGDLSASAFKRKMGIKDYGKLIPGHGGIMDRFDSVIMVAPVVYYYMLFIIGC